MNSPPSIASAPTGRATKLLDRVRDRIRRKGYAKRTEQSYAHWIKRFILFHGKPPGDAAEADMYARFGCAELNWGATGGNETVNDRFWPQTACQYPLAWSRYAKSQLHPPLRPGLFLLPLSFPLVTDFCIFHS